MKNKTDMWKARCHYHLKAKTIKAILSAYCGVILYEAYAISLYMPVVCDVSFIPVLNGQIRETLQGKTTTRWLAIVLQEEASETFSMKSLGFEPGK